MLGASAIIRFTVNNVNECKSKGLLHYIMNGIDVVGHRDIPGALAEDKQLRLRRFRNCSEGPAATG
jgi:hypothetical protein